MFDFRNHGESQKGITCNGLTEYQDAASDLEYLKNRPEVDQNRIGLVGFCMGSSAFIVMLAKTKMTIPKCLVAIQPTTMSVVAKGYLKRYIGSFLASIMVWLTGIINRMKGNCALNKMSPKKFASSVKIPTLYIQAEEDTWGTVEDVKSFHDATPAEKEFWIIKGDLERFDTYNYVGEHPERILDFLSSYV